MIIPFYNSIISNRSSSPAALPEVETKVPTGVTTGTFTANGNLVDDGGTTVTDVGFVYSSTNTDPKIGGAGVTQVSLGGLVAPNTFNSVISGLSDGIYYYRAYAINSAGTAEALEIEPPAVQSYDPIRVEVTIGGGDTGNHPYLTLGDAMVGTSYSIEVDWGDGSPVESWDNISNPGTTYGNDQRIYHNYTGTGTNIIEVIGIYPWIQFGAYGSAADKYTDVISWGEQPFINCQNMFRGCSNLDITTQDNPGAIPPEHGAPDLTQCDSIDGGLTSMFQDCTSFTGTSTIIDQWNITSVKTINSCFSQCYSFNGDITNWDLTGVKSNVFGGSLLGFLDRCVPFSHDLYPGMDFNGIETAQYLFRGHSGIVTDVVALDTSTVTNMKDWFSGANFAAPTDISLLDFSAVGSTGLQGMFSSCNMTNFIGVNTWFTTPGSASGFKFDSMFSYATNINDISGWDMTGVTSLKWLFKAANVTGLGSVNAWDVSSVTDFSETFRLSNFDQDISGWDISSATTMNDMFQGALLSTVNYDAILIGWEALVGTPNGINISFGTSQYTPGGAAEAARTSLENTYGWTITDGGPV